MRDANGTDARRGWSRRQVLVFAATYATSGGAAVAMPRWLAGASSSRQRARTGGVAESRPSSVVADALRRANALGKPLLVFVVPGDETARWDRGHVLGELLNYGGPKVLADLALCEVVCAGLAEIRAGADSPDLAEEPAFVLIDPREGTVAVHAIRPDLSLRLPSVGEPPRAISRAWHDWEAGVDGAILLRIVRAAESLRAAIAPDLETVQARAARVRPRLSESEVARLAAIADGLASGDPELVDRGAAVLRAIGDGKPDIRSRVLGHLADAAERRLVARPPTGADWARTEGCGVAIEGEIADTVSCGMGRVPERSQRFLRFFADRPR